MIHMSSRATPAALGRIVFVVLLTLGLPGAALAACPRWDVSGPLDLVQTNGSTVTANLVQTDTGLQGDARYGYDRDDGPFDGYSYYAVGGSVDGTLNGDTLDFTIYWTNQTTGVYTGRINSQGRVTGSTYDAQHPQTIANWHSGRTLKCQGPAPALPPPPKPTIALGRTQPLPGAAAGPPMSICERATAAAARNSPTAAALARQCIAAGGR